MQARRGSREWRRRPLLSCWDGNLGERNPNLKNIYLFLSDPTCQCGFGGFAGAGKVFSCPYIFARWTQLCARGHKVTPVSASAGSGARGHADISCRLPSLRGWHSRTDGGRQRDAAGSGSGDGSGDRQEVNTKKKQKE